MSNGDKASNKAMSKRQGVPNPLARGLLAALVGGALAAFATFGAGEWHLRNEAREIAEATANRAAQALWQGDEVSLGRALQDAAARSSSLESASVIAAGGEILASLGINKSPSPALPRLHVSVAVPPAGRPGLVSLETAHSRTTLLTMALFTGAIASTFLGARRILAAKSAHRDPSTADAGEWITEQGTEPREDSPIDRSLEGMHVLIADDSEISRRLLSLYVTRHGGQTEEAIDGQHAIEIAETTDIAYDCIVLDLHMPRIDGADAALKLRKRYPHTPILAVTAQSDTEPTLKRSNGFDACLIKPVAEGDLIGALRRLHSPGTPRAPSRGPSPGAREASGTESQIYDADRALELAGGNQALANELFDMLTKELGDQLKVLRDTSTGDDLLREIAHKLRASARYCATSALEERASVLEEAVLKAGTRSEIESARHCLCEAIAELLNTSERAAARRPDAH